MRMDQIDQNALEPAAEEGLYEVNELASPELDLSEIAYKWPDSQGLCPGITAGNSPVC